MVKNEPVINKVFINERLILIASFLNELRQLAAIKKQDFVSVKVNSAAAESFLRRALEAVFDIGRHILAKSGKIELAAEYKSIARGLTDLGIVDERLGQKLTQMAGYRNRFVHLYNLIGDEELYEIINSDLKDIEAFVSAVKKYLQNWP
jgi:uncharacterized protein YutE (UPF0331/DUF86 family)